MDDIFIGSVLASTLRVSIPLILCSLAGLFSERSGVVDIGLEGKILVGAFTTATIGILSGSLIVAVFAALMVTVFFSWIHGFACVSYGGDQIVSGVAINIIAAGLTAVLATAIFSQGGQTPPVPDSIRLSTLFPSLVENYKDIPWFGPIIISGLLGHNIMIYMAIAFVPLAWWILWRTSFGLRLRAVGENPKMVDAAGISVQKMRYSALTINGILCGLSGCYLILAQNPSFIQNMSAGRGFISLAAMIFGKWHPVGAFGACLLFGLLDALAIRMQGVDIPGIGEIPVQLVQGAPYVLTVILLAGLIGKAIPPKSVGIPYTKERT